MSPESQEESVIDKSLLKGELGSANRPKVFSQWFKQEGPRLGYAEEEINKLLLGCALDALQDDSNFVNWPGMIPFNPAGLSTERRSYIQRLNWEIDESILPSDIKRRLKKIRGKVEEREWVTKEDQEAIGVLWGQVDRYITQRKLRQPQLQDAINYYVDQRPGPLYEEEKKFFAEETS